MVLDFPDHEIEETSGFGQEVTFFCSACGALFHQGVPSFPNTFGMDWDSTVLEHCTDSLEYEKIRT